MYVYSKNNRLYVIIEYINDKNMFQLRSQQSKKAEEPNNKKSDLFVTDKKAYVDSTLTANKKLNFVERLYKSTEDIPTPKGKGPEGDRSTHLMSYDPGSKRVYPEVVEEKGKLVYKEGDKAYNYADKTKEYIEFPTAEKAEWFSSNYKMGTEVLGNNASPLHKQKLSPKAAKAKAKRDLAYAKTDDRRAKKADAQRRRRKEPKKSKGKDWDHKNQRWESPAQNRGNDGLGTKIEKGKKYKTR